MHEKIVVLITASSLEEGKRIGETLINEKLAACVNILNHIDSLFIWKDQFCSEKEVMLIIKTGSEKFDFLVERVKSIHSYEVPEIIALPIVNGSREYLNWIEERTGVKGRDG